MKHKIIVLFILIGLMLSGCHIDDSKESIKDALIQKFDAVYSGLDYEIELNRSDNHGDLYLVWSEDYYGVLSVRDGGGDICIYSYYTDQPVYVDHCEGVNTD